MKQYEEIKKCRICGNTRLRHVLDLGEQALTGVFPKTKEEKVLVTPLELVKCDEIEGCGLLQLAHNIELGLMYGDNYGYRSGLNKSMIDHLKKKAEKIKQMVDLKKGDTVIDIGSNDGTLLGFYPDDLDLMGIDPTAKKFRKCYKSYIKVITEFFSKKMITKKAKVITSIAMFYDLQNPVEFMREIYGSLEDGGIWVFEQAYMPMMLRNVAYDAICQEHLSFYRMKQIKWMTDRVGFKIVDVEFNDINGGSFSVTVAKKQSKYKGIDGTILSIIEDERKEGLCSMKPYEEFRDKVKNHKEELVKLIDWINSDDKKVFGYGASTKGNVILQYCRFNSGSIPYIAEVNQDKFGCFTPNTLIPIISEVEAKKKKPDYMLVLPWHFRKMIVKKEEEYLKKGGKLIFPLPKIKVVSK